MSKKMLIDATHPEETRVVVVDGNKVEEFDFESVNKRQLAGNIYLAKVTRVEPSLQAAFVDYGGNRHGFLAFSEIHLDYYQIPVADREALLAEEQAYAEAQAAEENEEKPKRRRRSRKKTVAESAPSDDKVTGDIAGMDVVDLDETDANEPVTDFGASDDGETSPAAEDAEAKAVEAPAEADGAPEAETDTQEDSGTEAAAAPDEADASEQEEEDEGGSPDAGARDPSIESVAQEDEAEDIRPRRKPRPRKYKIQEVIKVRQILLIQVVKEERGNKGAALTTYLSLAGRYCVLMPNTARGGGISRKITNAPDRKRLKEIAGAIEVPQGAGLIVRTAGAKRTKAEIKRDYDYLLRQWEQVRDLTLKSIAPSPIYEEGSLIKRSIRDLYNKEIDEVLIEGEIGYRTAKDYMKMLMPSHAKNVKLYTDAMPLFARFQVESYLSGMFNPTVQLRSGGYIVIGVTEALVAIDVNSGRATKESSIEDTALKTNLEAAEEVARQLRLRDLAGLIVIDFIDMEERRNNAAVEKRIKDKLKTDRARIQVGRISGFGLMEMSRQRLRPGMIEMTTQPCPHCHGTGLTRSDDNLALSILREVEEEGVRRRSKEVLITAPIAIANYMLNQKREHIAMIEARYGLSIRIEASPHLISPEYTIDKFKTATRIVPEATAGVVSLESVVMDTPAEKAEDVAAEVEDEAEGADEQPKKRRRRRRRRGGRGRSNNGDQNGSETDGDNGENAAETSDADAPAETPPEAADTAEDTTKPDGDTAEAKPKKKRASRTRTRKPKAEPAAEAEAPAEATGDEATQAEAPVVTEVAQTEGSEAPALTADSTKAEAIAVDEVQEVEPEPVAEAVPEPEPQPEPEPVLETAGAEPAPKKSKRRGWWSRG